MEIIKSLWKKEIYGRKRVVVLVKCSYCLNEKEYIKDAVYSKKHCYVKQKKTYLSEKYE